MAGRIAKVTQAELERALRAIKSAGLAIRRIVAVPEGYAIEIGEPAGAEAPPRPVL